MRKNKHTESYPGELGPDEEALAAAGLIRPEEDELERMVQETLAENFSDAFTEDPAPAEEELLPEEEVPVEEEPPKKKALLRKLRPKMKGAYGLWGIPHIVATVIWLALIAFIGGSIGQLGWACAADLLALGKEPMKVTIALEADDTVSEAAVKLQEAGLIRYPQLFEMFAKLTGKGEKLLFGNISFNDAAEEEELVVYDYNALMNKLSYRKRSSATREVMIPEGYNCAQIFALLEDEGICPAAELEAYAIDGELEEHWFLQGVQRGHKYCLEGFLFPDTYEFYLNETPENVFNKFLDNFDRRYSDDMRTLQLALKQRYGKEFTTYEILTVASIVEKEAANPDEALNIASVFYNRLTNPNFNPKYLGSDATILYATEFRDKGTLTDNNAINASPYNTYTHTGLPPTPISNPGVSSLTAALNPAKTNYLYFILDKSTGTHRFSETLAQHEALRNQLG